MASRREPVSVICVFSDADVRRRCLDRSIDEQRAEADVEYLPIDNTGGAFASAGAALNHAAAQARHEFVVFVHQDVYLHSLARLEEAAGMLADDEASGSWALSARRRRAASAGACATACSCSASRPRGRRSSTASTRRCSSYRAACSSASR
jgi:hypothetical protein